MNRKSDTPIFKNFDNLSANVIIEDFEAAKEFLADLKIDTNELSAQGINRFNKALFLAKARVNQTNDRSLLEKLRHKINESMERNAALTSEIIKGFFAKEKISFQFRNLEKWTDEELKEVLGDIDLIRLMEGLDEMEED